jgi:NAD(P)-dependent dehydrogenase (short-subunit alcohol dehydrogenase family)
MPELPFVLVTGASRGLGRDMALHLVRHGFNVLAGVRSPEDGTRLMAEAGSALHPVMLDVAYAGSIDAAAATVARLTGDAGLAGLVNNAGIASFVPLEQQRIEDFEQIFRVNVFGVQALTQALLPQLRRARGRIVNISSGNGKLAIPFSGAYSASKFALEALSDTLRMELATWGMHVSVVEPGAMATDIRVKGVAAWAAERERLSEPERGLYADQFAAVSQAVQGMEAGVGSALEVSEAVLQALTAPAPKSRYPVGPHMDTLDALVAMPDRERDQVAMGILGLGGAPPSPS